MPIFKVNLLMLFILINLLLTHCTTFKPSDTGDIQKQLQWNAHLHALQQLHQYQIRGSCIYLSNKKKFYARFYWVQHSPEHYRLLLLNPLGGTELDLNMLPNVTTLTEHQRQHYISKKNAETLQKITDIGISINNLRQWVLGLPGKSNNFILDDKYHLKKLLYQEGNLSWVVYYRHYNTDTKPPLPSQLELQNHKQCIKLKIDSWTLNDS